MIRKIVLMTAVVFIISYLTACGDTTWDAVQPEKTEDAETENTNIEPAWDTANDADTQAKDEMRLPERDEEEQKQSGGGESLAQRLASYRLKRESMRGKSIGKGVMIYSAPNTEDYGLESAAYIQADYFDTRELTEAFSAAEKYVKETLEIHVETNDTVYTCVDPEIIKIYEDADKGVAKGYEPENIFICEYCDNEEWQYLFLVREGKGKDWKVIHHGSSYKVS